VWTFCHHQSAAPGYQIETNLEWIPSAGIRYIAGADGVGIVLILLTGIVAVAGVLFSWHIEERAAEFFAFYFLLLGGVYGVFLSVDLFMLFVFYEIAIVPKYFLIARWGSTNREYAAMKLALYSFGGSALVLLGMIALYAELARSGVPTFDLRTLAEIGPNLPLQFQFWCFPLLFTGFAILAGMVPFHTWAPAGHVAAPTAGSMLLAGVVMKLGAYGCLKGALMIMPGALSIPLVIPYIGLEIPRFWFWMFSALAATNILYGAMAALVQKDFKYVIGYSSISHMGFVLIGLMTLNTIGVTGAVVQMFSHGVVASLMFAIVGGMIYQRTHTRDISKLGAFRLRINHPGIAIMFFIGTFAAAGLPGFSGFVAEFLVVRGTAEAFTWMLIPVGLGIIVTFAYTLKFIHLVFWGPHDATVKAPLLPKLKVNEICGGVFLIVILILFGLVPRLLTDVIEKDVTPAVKVMSTHVGGPR